MKKKALISVSDKTGVVDFAKKLAALDFEILSTGGTAEILENAGIKAGRISDITGFPEIMNGRVKTLHPKIHGAILADRDNKNHLEEAEKLGIEMIDLVCVNLYPFEQTIAKENVSLDEAIENIDIGGPTMVRSAAKNFRHIAIVTNKNDYEPIIKEYEEKGELSLETKQRLAFKAFAHTSAYDAAVTDYFYSVSGDSINPEFRAVASLKEELRYGENPHQKAGFYQKGKNELWKQLHGKPLSYNNFQDMDAALNIISKFTELPSVAIIKHTNPCGISQAENLTEAYQKAFATDTLSPFGGIVIVNRPLDMTTALEINKIFTEIILAPDFEDGVFERLAKKKNRRLIKFNPEKLIKGENDKQAVSCLGGFLVQDRDSKRDDERNWKVVTERKPTEEEMQALKFGWKAVAVLKSNAVAFSDKNSTLGLGIGQTSRIDSAEIAVSKAEKFGISLKGAICASDAFFPFRDSIDKIAEIGIVAVIQPGGSKGDQEVIEACNEYGIAMIFTGMRHFRH
ncbi:MAG: bifunctional phosphoribosylaminoimidazolecarboxamide formyltransferase/inosine monophosphate cyclohydrolase [Candidatus Cloacimonadota bacterium]|nr:MAG: bifunctional phosphoribosylaminoimidazolecarboxamide formyltransferase/inosine monophosphate cyclohydrolase [Candidatus Cloacimonadota bacterium]